MRSITEGTSGRNRDAANQSCGLFNCPPPPPAVEALCRDIRPTRPAIAERKAELSLTLHRLCLSAPASVRDGSINLTHRWLECQKRARKVAASTRASVAALAAAIEAMRELDRAPSRPRRLKDINK